MTHTDNTTASSDQLPSADSLVEVFWDAVPEGGLPEEFTTNGGKWGSNGTLGTAGGTVAWSLPSAGLANQSGSSSFFTGNTVGFGSIVSFDFQSVIQSVFDAWSAVANINFVQVADGGGNIGVGNSADIRIVSGFIDGDLPGGDILAKAFLPAPGNGSSTQGAAAGDVVMDSGQNWSQNLFFLTMLHEVGHSLGLSHSSVFPAIMQPTINTSLNGLQADDIAGIRAIYGNGGPSPTDDYAGNTTTTGTISLNGTVSGDIELSGDSDWFAVTLSANVQYTFNLEGSPTGGGSLRDPFLRLRDSSGNELALNDDGGTGLNSLLTFNPTTSGVYFLAAEAYGSNTGTYTLAASAPAGGNINGTAGNDPMLIGTSAADTINGFAGDDILEGMAAGDTLLGGAGNDSASYISSNDTVAVNIGNGIGAGAHAAGDILVGIENLIGSQFGDLLRGGGATTNNPDTSNFLTGLGGGDLILGDDGNDTIFGGAGGDIMTGGRGSDSFLFDNLSSEHDIIMDFDQSGDDRLTFTGFGAGFDFADFQLFTVNGNDVFAIATGWQGGVVLKDAAGQVDAGDFVFS